MSELTTKGNRDLFDILVAVAWLDGEIQAEEKSLLEKIAVEQNILENSSLDELLAAKKATSSENCYQLLTAYLGSNPSTEDYQNLLSAVSGLIYSDDNIATEEASLLTQMQNLDPQNAENNSTLNKIIAKIQKLYQLGIREVT